MVAYADRPSAAEQGIKPRKPESDRIVDKFLNGEYNEEQYRDAIRQETQRRINDRKKNRRNGTNGR